MQMEQIEKALGKPIVRIETNDLDEMEEVSAWAHRSKKKMLTVLLRK
jgi:hypothetical protein